MVYSRFFAVLLQKSDWYHCKGAAAATLGVRPCESPAATIEKGRKAAISTALTEQV
jgi:hypothetical protein